MNAGTTFSVRFVQNGDNYTLIRSVFTENGKGAGLFQVIDPEQGTVSPKWTDNPSAQPIIQLSVRSSSSYPVDITGVVFAYDGKTMHFTYNGDTWVTGDDDRFKSRINGGKYELRIVKDLASKEAVSNKQITYAVTFVCNAMTDTITGSSDVLIQQSGASSHLLQILVDGPVELSEEEDSTTLRAVAQYGTKTVTIGSDGYTIEWYQDDVLISGQTKAELAVNRSMVEGGSFFIAKLKKDGKLVAQDGQRVNDVADEYQIAYQPISGNGMVTMKQNASFKLSVTRNGKPMAGNIAYAWQIYNQLGIAKGSGQTDTVVVTSDDCLNEPENGKAYYSDADVRTTAEMN